MSSAPSGATDGFAFVAFASPKPQELSTLFEKMGLPEVARWRRGDVRLHRQGDIDFFVDARPVGAAAAFAAAHGPCAYGLGLSTEDAGRAHVDLLQAGAIAAAAPNDMAPDFPLPAIEGVGGLRLYLSDRHSYGEMLDGDFGFHPDWRERMRHGDAGLRYVDHVTHNLKPGGIAKWRAFYERFFGMRELRSFDIEGQVSGLVSTALVGNCGRIRIPLNEPKGLGGQTDQIQEFLDAYGGEGIQHIAFGTEDLFETVERLRNRGLALQDTPETYYDFVDRRLPGHGLSLERLRRDRILVDGATDSEPPRLLLQIFGQPSVGPIFFEFIQRKGDEGFGEGNFKALFESLELDQIRRGVLQGGQRRL